MKKYVDLVLKKEKRAISFQQIMEKIAKILQEENIELTDEMKEEVQSVLDSLVSSYDVYKTPSQNYILMSKTTFRKGKFYGERSGSGKVSVTTSYVDKFGSLVVNEDKYAIGSDRTNGAIDGDFVLIDIGNDRYLPKVVQILDRQLESIPGEVYRIGNSYFVKPVDKRKQGITIALEGEAIEGQRVSVSLKQQTSNDFYIGEIVNTFNHKDDPNADILWEAFKEGVDNDFSSDSLLQLESIPDKLRDCDRIGREDLTSWEIFTIDGADTKDMDDAISCTINDKGNYVLGVHITDIASIVPEDSPLDKDAFRKGNSFYLGGTVLPMFPHKISNGIGSLNPYTDRMTISTIMEINPKGEVVSYRISPTIIRSRLKMTYDKVNLILKEGIVDPDYKEFEQTLKDMQKLSLILRKKRFLAGSQEFNRPELKMYRDEDGEIQVDIRKQDVAENLIEEFMVIANHTVDKDLSKRGYPFLHRVHSYPNEDKLVELLKLLNAVNLPFTKYSAEELASGKAAYQQLVEHISKSGRLADLLSTEAIKCMSRAKYSPDNIGHFGLATDYYCHFTSPVRRDADLTNQRIVWDCIFRNGGFRAADKWEEKLPAIAEQTYKQERKADEAERSVIRLLSAEYMSHHLGEEFEGTVTGVSSECLTVQLDNFIEGTVRTRALKGSYAYSPDSYSLVSLEGEEDYYIGDHLRLKVKSASTETKKIEFEVVEKLHETSIQNAEEVHQNVKKKSKEEKRKRH